MSNEVQLLIVLFIGGTILVAARRFMNRNDPVAGRGVAGWTIFMIFLVVYRLAVFGKLG